MFGDESQTRSFIYVVDEVEGLLKAFHSDSFTFIQDKIGRAHV